MIETNKISYEKAILIGIINSVQSETIVNDYLNELSFLTETAGGHVSKRFIQRVDKPNPKTFIGSGKIIAFPCIFPENSSTSINLQVNKPT